MNTTRISRHFTCLETKLEHRNTPAGYSTLTIKGVGYMIIIIEYILYVYMRHTGVADLHTHVTEYNGTKQGQAQTAVVPPVERACPTTIGHTQLD